MSEKKITIKDIAKLAHVSAGTVDRVLHDRGKVSEVNRKKVEAVLKEINYEPNLIAKTLKNNRLFRIVGIIPSTKTDEYWQKARQGLMTGLQEFRSFGVDISICEYDINDSAAFIAAFQEALNLDADGVLAVPIFHDEAPEQFQLLDAADIPYMTFNTHLKELKPQSYIGQHLLQSGRLAAQLTLMHRKKSGAIAMIHVNEHPDKANHAREKEEGFKNYLNDIGIDLSLFHSISVDEGDSLHASLSTALEQIPNLSAVHVSTSKAFLINEVLKSKYPQCTLSGYDLINENVALLRSHQIAFLIDQKPVEQAYQAVARFTDLLVFNKQVATAYLMPLNVAFAENIDSMLSESLSKKTS